MPCATNCRRSSSSPTNRSSSWTTSSCGSTLDAEANSIAIMMRHMAGNMRSRWTDFLTSDGEKPDRQRDREFEDPRHTPGGTARGVGRRLAAPVRRARSADRCGSPAHGDHSRGAPFRLQGDQPPGRALRRARVSDPVARPSTCKGADVDDAVDSARAVRGVQPPHAGQTSAPEN